MPLPDSRPLAPSAAGDVVSREMAAARAVCARAHNTDDARLLLTALGLLVNGELDWPEPGVLEINNIKNVYAIGGRAI
jgi:hypothetical protein